MYPVIMSYTLQGYMPLPPVNEEKAAEGSEESTEPQIEFSYVECLMYSFHQVARKVCIPNRVLTDRWFLGRGGGRESSHGT